MSYILKAACAATSATILYTADHELMARWEVGVSSNGATIPPIAPALPSGNDTRQMPPNAFGKRRLNIGSWQPCAYRLTLTTRRKLTDGEGDDPVRTAEVPFCKR